jgi:hypothetical protein
VAWIGDLADFSAAMWYGTEMTKTVAEKLADLVKAVRELPDDTQEVLVDEFAGRLSDFTDSTLSDEQRAEIDRRLANPRYADPDKVRSSSPALVYRTDERCLSRRSNLRPRRNRALYRQEQSSSGSSSHRSHPPGDLKNYR